MQVGLTWTANTPEVTETLMSASTLDADVILRRVVDSWVQPYALCAPESAPDLKS